MRAAEKLFVEEGYQGATIRKIAEQVGLSSTALYMHFRDKNEILIEICRATFDELRKSNESIASLPLPPVERARRMLLAYIDFALANPSAYVVIFERTLNLETEQIALLGEQVARPFHEVLAALSEAAPLRCQAEEATQICWAACHGMVSLMINNDRIDWAAEREKMASMMVDTLISGLKA